MYRNRAYRRHHNKRVIAKRRNIIVNIWSIGISSNGLYNWRNYHIAGKYKKFNLNCGCKMCHFYKRKNNNDKYYPKNREKNIRNLTEKEIRDYKYYKT